MGPRLRHAKHRLSQRAVDWLLSYVFLSEFEGETPNVRFVGKACQVYALDQCTDATLRSLLHGDLPDTGERTEARRVRKSKRRRANQLRIKTGTVGALELVVSLDKSHSELARRDPRWDAATTRVLSRMVDSIEDCVGIRTQIDGSKVYIHTGRAVVVVVSHELSREHEPQKHWHIYVLNMTPRDDTVLSYAVDRTAIFPNISAILELARSDLRYEALTEGMALDDTATIAAIDPRRWNR